MEKLSRTNQDVLQGTKAQWLRSALEDQFLWSFTKTIVNLEDLCLDREEILWQLGWSPKFCNRIEKSEFKSPVVCLYIHQLDGA